MNSNIIINKWKNETSNVLDLLNHCLFMGLMSTGAKECHEQPWGSADHGRSCHADDPWADADRSSGEKKTNSSGHVLDFADCKTIDHCHFGNNGVKETPWKIHPIVFPVQWVTWLLTRFRHLLHNWKFGGFIENWRDILKFLLLTKNAPWQAVLVHETRSSEIETKLEIFCILIMQKPHKCH